MTIISSLSSKGYPGKQGYLAMKKRLISMYRAELKKAGIDAERLSVDEVFRLHSNPAIREKIAILETTTKQKPKCGAIQPVQKQQTEADIKCAKIYEAQKAYVLPRLDK